MVARESARPSVCSCRTDVALRADTNPHDVLRVMNSIWFLPAGPEWRDAVGRMLDLVIDGLRSGAPDRVPKTKR